MPLIIQDADPDALRTLMDFGDEKNDCALRAAFEHDEYFAEAQHNAVPYVLYVERLSAEKVTCKAMNIIWD